VITQLALLPDVADNDLHEPTVKRPSVPVAKLIGGRWCWKRFGADEYRHEPELERVLLAALARQQRKAA
jgi:hypothetical protein